MAQSWLRRASRTPPCRGRSVGRGRAANPPASIGRVLTASTASNSSLACMVPDHASPVALPSCRIDAEGRIGSAHRKRQPTYEGRMAWAQREDLHVVARPGGLHNTQGLTRFVAREARGFVRRPFELEYAMLSRSHASRESHISVAHRREIEALWRRLRGDEPWIAHARYRSTRAVSRSAAATAEA